METPKKSSFFARHCNFKDIILMFWSLKPYANMISFKLEFQLLKFMEVETRLYKIPDFQTEVIVASRHNQSEAKIAF